MTSLNPVLTIGEHVAEPFKFHQPVSASQAWRLGVEMLKSVGIPGAARRAHDYPHQFSGGMRQRVMIASALACRPDLIVADEPTTALDVSIQAQILVMLREARQQGKISPAMVEEFERFCNGEIQQMQALEKAWQQRRVSPPKN